MCRGATLKKLASLKEPIKPSQRIPDVTALQCSVRQSYIATKTRSNCGGQDPLFFCVFSSILDSAFVVWPLLESMKIDWLASEYCSLKQRCCFTPVTAATQPAENNSLWQFHSISMRTAGIRLCSLPKRTQSILLRVAWNDACVRQQPLTHGCYFKSISKLEIKVGLIKHKGILNSQAIPGLFPPLTVKLLSPCVEVLLWCN